VFLLEKPDFVVYLFQNILGLQYVVNYALCILDVVNYAFWILGLQYVCMCVKKYVCMQNTVVRLVCLHRGKSYHGFWTDAMPGLESSKGYALMRYWCTS
jgi:hypothetical protein